MEPTLPPHVREFRREGQASRHPMLLLIGGAGMVLVGIILSVMQGEIGRKGIVTEGTVIRYEHVVPKDYDDTGDPTDLLPSREGYRAVVEFAAEDGKTYKFTSSDTREAPGETGAPIKVTYLARNPYLALAGDEEKRSSLGYWLLAAGLGAAGLGWKIMRDEPEVAEEEYRNLPGANG